MYFKSILCFSFAAVTLTLGNQTQDDVKPNDDASYEFGYDVHNPLSNDIKSHHEIRDGKNVLGFYTFKEADGTIRIVKYKVTPDTGFEAVVEKLQPDLLNGNSIDGQEAAQSTHGASTTILDVNGGHNSQFVAGTARTNPNSQDNIPSPNQNHPERYRNPYIIRRNPRYDQQSQLPAVYSYNIQRNHDIPRGRHKIQQFFQEPNREFQTQGAVEEHIQPFTPRDDGYVGHYANNPDSPAGPLVYIDGIPYIDDIGYTDQLKKGEIPHNVYVPSLDRQNPQYAVQENPEDNAIKEADSKVDDNDKEANKEEFDKEDEDYDENAEYEEEDDPFVDDDDEADATEFYEENTKLINEQQKQYDELKKAYEEDIPVPEAKEEAVEVEQSEATVEIQPEAH